MSNVSKNEKKVQSANHARKSKGKPWSEGFVNLPQAFEQAGKLVALTKAGTPEPPTVPRQVPRHLAPLRERLQALIDAKKGNGICRVDVVRQELEQVSIRSLDSRGYRTNLRTTLKWVLGLVEVSAVDPEVAAAWGSRLQRPQGAPESLALRRGAAATAKSARDRFVEWACYAGVTPESLAPDWRLSEFRRYLREVRGLGSDRVRDLGQFAAALLREAGFQLDAPKVSAPLPEHLERFVRAVEIYATGRDGEVDLIDEDLNEPLTVNREPVRRSTFIKNLSSFKALYRFLREKHGAEVEKWSASEILKYERSVAEYLRSASRTRVHGGIFTYMQMPKSFWEWGVRSRAPGFEEIPLARAEEVRTMCKERATPRVLRMFKDRDTRLTKPEAISFIFPAYAKGLRGELARLCELLEGGSRGAHEIAKTLRDLIMFSTYVFFAPNHADVLLMNFDPEYKPSDGLKGRPDVWKSESPDGNYFLTFARSKTEKKTFFQFPAFLTPLLDLYIGEGYCSLLFPDGAGLLSSETAETAESDSRRITRIGGRFLVRMTRSLLGKEINEQRFRKEASSAVYSFGFADHVEMILGHMKIDESGDVEHRGLSRIARRHYVTPYEELVEREARDYYGKVLEKVRSLATLHALAERVLELGRGKAVTPMTNIHLGAEL